LVSKDKVASVGSQPAYELVVAALGCLWYSFLPQGGNVDDNELKNIDHRIHKLEELTDKLKKRIDSLEVALQQVKQSLPNPSY